MCKHVDNLTVINQDTSAYLTDPILKFDTSFSFVPIQALILSPGYLCVIEIEFFMMVIR